MPGLKTTERNELRRDDAARLIAVAINMLDDEGEQIVRDYLTHALGALGRVREAEHIGAASK